MPDFPFQDWLNAHGYVALPRKPWATGAAVAPTGGGRSVFGDPRTARFTYAAARPKLMYYDDKVERQRRLLCDAVLGRLLLGHPKYAQPAVKSVGDGIGSYGSTLRARLSGVDPFKAIVGTDGQSVFNPTRFGRLPVAQPSPSEIGPFKAMVESWPMSLSADDRPRFMSCATAVRTCP